MRGRSGKRVRGPSARSVPDGMTDLNGGNVTASGPSVIRLCGPSISRDAAKAASATSHPIPNSPFAKLAALKEQLEANAKERR